MKPPRAPRRQSALKHARLTLCFGTAMASMCAAAWSQEDPAGANVVTVLARVVVIGTTPLLGIGTPLSQVPANIQTVYAKNLERQHRPTLTDYFEKNLPSVNINEAQGNPYQIDVNYRGFTASPLLGTPQGLTVFLDGVCINEPFGDVVNWDLFHSQPLAPL